MERRMRGNSHVRCEWGEKDSGLPDDSYLSISRQILALAVGLAELSARKAGVKISTLLIDEPSGLDKQGLIDFGKSFIKLVESRVFRKGILMAHEEILKDIFDHKILVTKEGTTSRVEVLV